MSNLLAAALAILCLAPPPDRPGDELRKERDAIEAREEMALNTLADKLGDEVSQRIKALLEPATPADGSTRFVPLGELIAKTEPVAPAELQAIREEAAEAYFKLATRCLPPAPLPHLALADECLRSVVARDPSNAHAWRLLGYVPHEGGWATPFAIAKLAEGQVLHQTYGWVDKSWVAHLEKGELPGPYVAGKAARWLPTADADAFRRDFAKGWQISTEHFVIQTNVPLNEAIGFGRRLESLRELFGSMMADVIGPELLPLALLAKNPKAVPPAPKKHRVFYFADRNEYIEYLLPTQGQGIRDNLGNYLPKKDTKGLRMTTGASFFFRDPGGQLDVTENLDHEVSHQLLFEMAGADKYNPDLAHFWVFEGLGTYFETLRPQPDGALRIGGLVGKRIEIAQIRLVKNGDFIPISRLATYNKNLFYGGDGGDIYLHYAEAMALSVFFMQAHDCRYREGFLEYARDVYKGRLKAGAGKTLEDRLGTDFGTLARDFLNRLKQATPVDDPAAAPRAP